MLLFASASKSLSSLTVDGTNFLKSLIAKPSSSHPNLCPPFILETKSQSGYSAGHDSLCRRSCVEAPNNPREISDHHSTVRSLSSGWLSFHLITSFPSYPLPSHTQTLCWQARPWFRWHGESWAASTLHPPSHRSHACTLCAEARAVRARQSVCLREREGSWISTKIQTGGVRRGR